MFLGSMCSGRLQGCVDLLTVAEQCLPAWWNLPTTMLLRVPLPPKQAAKPPTLAAPVGWEAVGREISLPPSPLQQMPPSHPALEAADRERRRSRSRERRDDRGRGRSRSRSKSPSGYDPNRKRRRPTWFDIPPLGGAVPALNQLPDGDKYDIFSQAAAAPTAGAGSGQAQDVLFSPVLRGRLCQSGRSRWCRWGPATLLPSGIGELCKRVPRPTCRSSFGRTLRNLWIAGAAAAAEGGQLRPPGFEGDGCLAAQALVVRPLSRQLATRAASMWVACLPPPTSRTSPSSSGAVGPVLWKHVLQPKAACALSSSSIKRKDCQGSRAGESRA